MRKARIGLVCAALACGGDPEGVSVTQREAELTECASGGMVLVIDGEEQAPVCNGADGADGLDGAQGAPGVAGPRGEQGDAGARGATGATGATGTSGADGESAAASVSETIACISAKKASLVAIQCTDGNVIGVGSGTVTLSGQVYTAAHVVADLETMTCSIFDVDVDHSTLIGTVTTVVPDGPYDAALVNVAWSAPIPAGVVAVSDSPALGEMVVATGHPNAFRALQYSTGYVTAVGITEMGADWAGAFMADYSSNGGGSGGAIFNADCQWIGIHVGGFSDGLETSVALPFGS